MVEHDVATLIGQDLTAGLHGTAQNLVHALYVAVGADNGGKVLRRPLQRGVQADTTSRNIKKQEHPDRP